MAIKQFVFHNRIIIAKCTLELYIKAWTVLTDIIVVGYTGWTAVADAVRVASHTTFVRCQPEDSLQSNLFIAFKNLSIL